MKQLVNYLLEIVSNNSLSEFGKAVSIVNRSLEREARISFSL